MSGALEFAICEDDNVVCPCLIEDPPAQEADKGSVSPRLRRGEEEEEDSSEEGTQHRDSL